MRKVPPGGTIPTEGQEIRKSPTRKKERKNKEKDIEGTDVNIIVLVMMHSATSTVNESFNEDGYKKFNTMLF